MRIELQRKVNTFIGVESFATIPGGDRLAADIISEAEARTARYDGRAYPCPC